MATTFMTTMYVIGMLLFGSLNTITMKIQFSMSAAGSDGKVEQFKKPWFGTYNMFFAMTLVLFAEGFSLMYKRRGKTAPLLADYSSPSGEGGGAAANERTWGQKVCLVAIPSVFDLVATGMCCIGMLYIPASVWQMLRGAEIVFAALLAVAALNRRLYAFNWIGIGLCVVGVTFVGLANVWGNAGDAKEEGKEGAKKEDAGLLVFGMILVVGGQVVQAAQVIAEEWLLKDVDLPEMQIIGFEGFWGLLMMTVFVYPALYAMAGDDHGHQEDIMDTFSMINNSPDLAKMVVLYSFSCATYNVTGIAVTGALSAVHRAMLEASRTIVIWTFGIFVHYKVDANSKYGEEWTDYSWLQMVGFVVLMSGQAIYGEILTVPGLYYPPPEAPCYCSPAAQLKLSSPLPRHASAAPDSSLD